MNTTRYFVTTETRNYNSVDSAEQFVNVRKAWGDYSKVKTVFIANGIGWVKVEDTKPFEVR